MKEVETYDQHLQLTRNVLDSANDMQSNASFTAELAYNKGKMINFRNSSSQTVLNVSNLINILNKMGKNAIILATFISSLKHQFLKRSLLGLGHKFRSFCSEEHNEQRLDALKSDLIHAGFDNDGLHDDL